MSISFFPKAVKFFDLFERQSTLVKNASITLAAICNDYEEVSAKCQKINQLEAEGDNLSREISSQLSLTFITPLDREDIHAINMGQEDVLNLIKAIASRIGLYQFTTAMEKAAADLVNNLQTIIEEIDKMIKNLSSKNAVEEHCKTVHRIKNESELHLLLALGSLYESKPAANEELLHIVMWTQIYDRIEQVLDKAEALANIIEGISIKNA